MKAFSATLVIFLVCLVSYTQTSAEKSTLPVGKLIEKIIVQSDNTQSYAAYLPSNYTPQKKWATIFCFDPLARGKFAVEHFQTAAEKYGFIIVCSNNSRNGLDVEDIQRILTGFSQDVNARFKVDEKRTYAAGFSGGARLAVSLAVACHTCVAGVIAAGAGFPGNLQPSSQFPFAYFGAVGFDDFNFGEVRELERKFSELPADYRFESFDGGHEWMNEKVAGDALAWLNIQAMKTSTLERDEKFIEEQFSSRRDEADRLLAEKQFVAAYQGFTAIVHDFGNWRDVSSLKTKAGQLKNSDEMKKEAQSEGELIKRQSQTINEIVSLWMNKSDSSGENSNSRQEARSKLNDWRKKSEAATDSSDRRLARRLLFGLFISAVESGSFQLQQKNYDLASAQFEFARAIDPKNVSAAYQLARIYAFARQKKMALQTLEEAVELGFQNVEMIKSDEAFTTISQESRFQKLVSGMK